MIMENSQLYRGIFWINDINNIYCSDLFFSIPCDENGMALEKIPPEVSSKNDDNYNHKKLSYIL